MFAHFMLRTYVVNKIFFREKIGFDDSFDVTKCLQQIEMPDLLHVCAKWNEQPSNIETMINPNHIGIKYSLIVLGGGGNLSHDSILPYLLANFILFFILNENFRYLSWLLAVSNRDICFIKAVFYCLPPHMINFFLNYSCWNSLYSV